MIDRINIDRSWINMCVSYQLNILINLHIYIYIHMFFIDIYIYIYIHKIHSFEYMFFHC